MEFVFSVNSLFPDTITRLTGKDVLRCGPEVQTVIDAVGEASRIAQGLHRPVTISATFYGSDQTVYILKDGSSNSGRGSILGLLKVGPKKLFLLNRQGTQNEIVPLCVLDFYVHESCQRQGLGKKLFEHFLLMEKVNVSHLAIDRPSEKFLGFLRKHYKLTNQIPQVNNFVIFEGFFNSRPEKNSGGEISNYRRSVYGNADAYNPCEIRQSQNSNRLMNRWSSVICLGDDPWTPAASKSPMQPVTTSPCVADPAPSPRRNQTNVASAFDQEPENRNDSLWRAQSFADVRQSDKRTDPWRNPYSAGVPVTPAEKVNPLPMKFQHHRLW